jgi:pyridoxal phosphate enzyme (YggS family)
MSLAHRLREVHQRIARACDSCSRDPASVTLVAVTKTVSAEGVRAAYDLGHRAFGENRLQEALPKIEALPDDAEWHFIGRLQSNKAKAVARAFDVIHTLENEGQLREIGKVQGEVDGLIELNLAKEPQKSGIFREALDRTVIRVLECENVRFRGLMTVGPLSSDPEGNRPLFRLMSELGREVGAQWLSMGMSADLEVAIQEGSTHVRVGTAIFGERG